MNKLCTICARGGSKGLKNKNIRDFLGKPLIAHSIIQARLTNIFKYIAVSSDSIEILNVAEKWGADILVERPMLLATDESPKIPAILHCLKEVEKKTGREYEILVDLSATSPLRTPEDIIQAVRLLENKNSDNVFSATLAHSSPFFSMVELDDKGHPKLIRSLPSKIIRRQDAPPCYDINGSIYVWTRGTLLNSESLFNKRTFLYEMPQERSIDIDTEIDFQVAEFLGRRNE